MLRHPHLVSVFGAIIQPPRIVLVSEFVELGTFTSKIEKKDLGTFGNKIRILLGIAKCMSYLHDHNVTLHKDLLPRHILFDQQDIPNVKVFGVKQFAVVERQENEMDSIFMAPELLSGDFPTPKSDVFSFAILGYLIFFEINQPNDNLSMISDVGTYKPVIP